MQKQKYLFNVWNTLLFVLAIAGAMTVFTACGDDEPDQTTIDYYMDVEEEFLVNGSTDHTDRYYNPKALMMEAVRTAYPTPDAAGNDEAVIAACDQMYQRYLQMYTGKAEHLTCLMHLVRAVKTGDIVRKSEPIKTYSFDINPYETEP